MSPLTFSAPFPPPVVGSVADAAAWRAVCAAAPACDVAELRADGLTAAELAEVDLSRCPLPVLLTVRCPGEGGLNPNLTTEDRARIAPSLLPHAAALDWEIAHLAAAPQVVEAAHAAGIPVIASAHDFEKTPDAAYCRALEQQARELGADVVKFAFRLNRYEDIQCGIDLLRGASGPMAVMGMGALGAVSRLVYAQHGSALVYGYVGNSPTAPGQWSAELFAKALTVSEPIC